jgi:hypothetical protein
MAQQVLESIKSRGKGRKSSKGKNPGGGGRGQGGKVRSDMKKRMTCYQAKFERKRSLVVPNVSIHHRKNKSVVKWTARLHKASQQITFHMKRPTRGRTAQKEK